MSAPLRCLLVVSVCLVASACDRQGEPRRIVASPTSPTASVPPSLSQPVRIVSGITQQPVAGATVAIDGHIHQTDQDGTVVPGVSAGVPPTAEVDVDAPGFLKRQTRLSEGSVITLWPVASGDEAQAVREMVYRRGGSSDQILHPPDPSSPFYVTLEGASSEVFAAWSHGAMAFGARFGLSYQAGIGFQYDTQEILVRFGEGTGCRPTAAWGFCREPSPYTVFTVLPGRAFDDRTIRRVVASWFLGPNPLPGLMNPDAPADDLSRFEVETIRMILLRRRPNRWPDNDR